MSGDGGGVQGSPGSHAGEIVSNPKLQLDLVVDDKGDVVLKNFGDQVERSMDKAARSVSGLDRQFMGLGSAVAGLAGAAGVGLLAKSFFDVGIQADAMGRGLSAAMGSISKAIS